MRPRSLLLSLLLFGSGIGVWILRSHLASQDPDAAQPVLRRKLNPKEPSILRKNNKEGATSADEQVEIAKKLQILNEVFLSKNDNDPRLDQEFNQLSSHAKYALEEKYEQTEIEKRNERGTLVFLIGKSLSTIQDFEFLKKIVSEPPCLSLTQCSTGPQETQMEDVSATEVTLDYPQIVALKSIENYLQKNPNSLTARKVLREAENSKSAMISKMAAAISKGIDGKNNLTQADTSELKTASLTRQQSLLMLNGPNRPQGSLQEPVG